jgi:CRISPR/Cas system CSM-associated protein Csm2 small subunit
MGQIVFQATLGGQTALVGQNTASSYSLTLPLATDTLVGKATTDTLTNKTLTSPTINGGTSTATQNLANVTGTLAVGNGGTGLVSLSSGYIPYGNGTSAFSSSSNLYFSGSNLGIGTSSPSSLLSLSGSNASPIGLSITNSNSGTVTNLSSMGATGSGVTNWANSTVLESIPTSTGGLVLSSYTGYMYFQTNGRQTFMTLNSAGYLGIGTTTPAQQLSVINNASVTGGHSNTLTSGAYFYLRGDSGSGAGQGSFFQINANYGLDTWLYNTNTSTFNLATTLSSTGQLGVSTIPNSSYGSVQIKTPSSAYSLDILGRTAGTISDSQLTFWDKTQTTTLAFWSTTSTYSQIGSNTYLSFLTNGSNEGMRLTSAGYLGIGTSSPSALLHVSGGVPVIVNSTSNNQFQVQYNGTTYGQWFASSGAAFGVQNGAGSSTLMTLDTSGNLGLGTIPSAWSSGGYALQLAGGNISANNTLYLSANNYYNGSNNKYISNGYAGYYSINNSNGQHQWYTAPSGSANGNISFTQAMTLDNSGNLLVGTTSNGGAKLKVIGNSTTICTSLDPNSTTATTLEMLVGSNDTTQVAMYVYSLSNSNFNFRVFSNGNTENRNNSYSAISDIKLKENIVDATPKLNDLCKVKVRNYNLIGEQSKQIGVIAQELEEVFPSMIDETADKDAEGNNLGTTTKSVKYSVFVPMLIKAIQELKAEFDAYIATHP